MNGSLGKVKCHENGIEKIVRKDIRCVTFGLIHDLGKLFRGCFASSSTSRRQNRNKLVRLILDQPFG